MERPNVKKAGMMPTTAPTAPPAKKPVAPPLTAPPTAAFVDIRAFGSSETYFHVASARTRTAVALTPAACAMTDVLVLIPSGIRAQVRSRADIAKALTSSSFEFAMATVAPVAADARRMIDA